MIRLSPRQTRPCWVIGLTLLGLVIMAASPGQAADLPADQVEFFESRIRPVLAQECYECHNSKGKEKGGLILDHRAAWQAGGDSGPVIVQGEPSGSLLMKAIRHEISDLEMPKAGAKLDEAILADFEKWIALGAPDPRDAPPTEAELAADTDWDAIRDRRAGWWSFQPIRRPAIPEVTGVTDPVDRFIRARLAREDLAPAHRADPRSLVRRLHFILVGLPPSPEETATFLAHWDRDPDGAVIDRTDALLADSRFGETWARHWMDWTRYADTHGSEGDPVIPHAWRYRDYLIRALNADVSYDQLVMEHFAGDLLETPRVNGELQLNESALGLGHLRMVFHGFAPTDALDERVRFTDDQINTVTKAFLGLTVSCARCHNHKFDAISQADFHALFGIFSSALPATVAVDAPGVLDRNRDALAALKPVIREQIAAAWLDSIHSDPSAWGQLTGWGDEAARIGSEWNKLRDHLARKQAEAAQARAGDSVRHHWDLTDPAGLAEWSRYGEGLADPTPSPSGEFILATEGATLIDDILPAGVYSHRLSSRHRGVLASAPFDLDGEFDLYLNVAGENTSARYAVQHYPRSGTVYPVTDLKGGDWRWIKYDRLDYWKGDRIHLELATAGDAPILVKDDERSWFGIREALLLKKGSPSPAPPEQAFLAPLFATAGDRTPGSIDEAVGFGKATLRRIITEWGRQDGGIDDDDALFLRAALAAGLLPNELDSFPPELRTAVERYRVLEAEVPIPTRAPGVFERPGVDQPLFARGDHKQPGDPVPRRFLEAIDATPYSTEGTGRLEFARDLLREDNPFTARVIVNRLWHHLFGEGLVPTTDNFGRLGEKPSHPELLDHLADRFRSDLGWSLKSMIRELVLTGTWQQSSQPSAEALERDPANRLLSHATVRRLGAEAIRDAFLAESGQLDSRMFGPPVDGSAPRRSLYLRVKRNDLDPLLTTFDFPVPASAVGRRDSTNVPAQSLTLLNDPFVIRLAGQWADRIEGPNDDAKIAQLFEAALTRPPTESERAQARDFLYAIDEEHRGAAERFGELTAQLAERRKTLGRLVEPVRAQLMAERRNEAGTDPAEPVDLKPAGRWTFDEDLADSAGNLNGKLVGTARIEDGALVVDGGGFVATAPLDRDLAEKTLEAVVQLDTLDQRGGGVMTIQDLQGGAFDSLVFAEKAPGQWLAGSNNFARTLDFNGPAETDAAREPVHLALVHESDGTIRAYRNGQPYGEPIRKAPLHVFRTGEAQVVFGLRHGTSPSGNRPLRGRILEARLHDRALTPEEVRTAATGDRVFVSKADVMEALGEARRAEKTGLEGEIAALESEIEALRRLGSDVPPEQRRWRDLAHAIFNLKEFIYLR